MVRGDVLAWRPRHDATFDIAFLDPPYGETEHLARALLAVQPRLAPAALVVAKYFWRDAPPDRVGLLASERERRFGETALTFYRAVAQSTEDR